MRLDHAILKIARLFHFLFLLLLRLFEEIPNSHYFWWSWRGLFSPHLVINCTPHRNSRQGREACALDLLDGLVLRDVGHLFVNRTGEKLLWKADWLTFVHKLIKSQARLLPLFSEGFDRMRSRVFVQHYQIGVGYFELGDHLIRLQLWKCRSVDIGSAPRRDFWTFLLHYDDVGLLRNEVWCYIGQVPSASFCRVQESVVYLLVNILQQAMSLFGPVFARNYFFDGRW